MRIVEDLRPQALSAGAFAAFGDVVEAGENFELINDGTTRQFADLAKIDVAADGGHPRISIYRTTPHALPLTIRMLERHPHSSQLFMPLSGEPFLVVVAPAGEDPEAATVRAFVTDGRQGVNYRRGTWHHPLIALRDPSEFLVIDRAGRGRNCDEYFFRDEGVVLQRPA
ncbi:MAG TPA: ureidoglycolate lyase [Steroidobacteraceae bacterium]